MTRRIPWRALLIVAVAGWPKAAVAQPPPPPQGGTVQVLQQLVAEVAELREAVRSRRFYLTRDTADGSQALNACAVGFHMASLWEIFDVTSLKYDTTLGFTTADSGEGPPNSGDDSAGWIRTGNVSLGFSTNPSSPHNCGAWTQTVPIARGTIAWLPSAWEGGFEPAGANDERIEPAIIPWSSARAGCSLNKRVWCVQDR